MLLRLMHRRQDRRGFQIWQNVTQVPGRVVHLIFVQVFLQLLSVCQHGRGQDWRVGPQGVWIGRIGRAGYDKADVAACATKNGCDTFAANTL